MQKLTYKLPKILKERNRALIGVRMAMFGLSKALIVVFAVLAVLVSVATAQDTVCAKVRIEIRQELTFERQAFEAEMAISNTLDSLSLQNVQVEVVFKDDNGNTALATSNPDDEGAAFFIRLDSLQNIANVTGSGSVAPATKARLRWLIIPSAGASGGSLAGKRYFVGAKLSYRLGGELQELEVAPDFIFVRPQPELELDYFIPEHIRSDDPQTVPIEPAEPFNLGVRIINSGYGMAHSIKIESAQPRIVENQLNLAIGFSITGSSVNDEPAEPTLLINFGDLAGGRTTVGRWIMETTLSGRFTDFGARFSHSDELGGRVTSLLSRVGAHFLVRDVNVDLPGRDKVRDFLAKDGALLNVYESEGLDTQVTDVSSGLALIPDGSTAGSAFYKVNVPQVAGFLYLKLADPHGGTKDVVSVRREDGKAILLDNAWNSAEGLGAGTLNYFNLFDSNGGGEYRIEFGTKVQGPAAPVLHFILDRTVIAGERITFIVVASDPNGTTPSLSLDAKPIGSNFTDEGGGQGEFDWLTTPQQVGRYPVTFRASDGVFTSARTAIITVQANPDQDGDGMPDAWEIAHFGTTDRDGTDDYDGDGVSDKDEFDAETDPTFTGDMPGVPVIESPLNGSDVNVLQPTLSLINIEHGVDLPTYNFELYSDQSLTEQVAVSSAVSEGATTTAWIVPNPLNENSWYYWRARAVLNNRTSDWVYGSFFVNIANDAPGTFLQTAPPVSAEVGETQPFLTVSNSTDADGDIVTYAFDVATDATGTNIIASVSDVAAGGSGGTSWQVQPALNEGQTYYWRATATDEHNASTSTDWISFFVAETNEGPSVPLLLSPIGDVEITTLSTQLTLRNSLDPDGDALTYYFEVDTVSTFSSPEVLRSTSVSADPSGDTRFGVSALSDNTAYYWRARASDGQIYSDWALGQFFVNTVNDLPPVPTLRSPGNGAVIQERSPTLSVNPVVDIDRDSVLYIFELFNSANLIPANRILVSAVPAVDLPLGIQLEYSRAYYWRVASIDQHWGLSATSPVSSFVVDEDGINNPPTFNFTAPTAAINANTGSVTISWADADPDSNASIRLFANNTLIAGPLNEDPDGVADTFIWQLGNVAPGHYMLRAEISDATSTISVTACCPIRVVRANLADADGDGVPNADDNCPYYSNATQADSGGLIRPVADGIGDACQCGDVDGDGLITNADGNLIVSATANGSNVTMPFPERCNVASGNTITCTKADGTRILSAIKQQEALWAKGSTQKVTTIKQNCVPARP